MARIRSIKPDFWTDEALSECSPSARLLFVGTWTFADDRGNLERSAKQLKAQVFPHDTIETEPLLQELIAAGLLIEYTVDGKKFLHIKGFEKHQRIDKESKPKHPLYEPSANTPVVLAEPSTSSKPSSSSLGGEMFLGGEGRGIHTDARETPRALASTPRALASPREVPHETPDPLCFERVRLSYPKFSGNQSCWLIAERNCHRLIAEGEGWEMLERAAERYAAWVKAGGVSGPQYVIKPDKFFDPSNLKKPWLDIWEPPASKADRDQQSRLDEGAAWVKETSHG